MDEFSDGKAIFTKPQDVVWSRVDDPNKWEVLEPYGYFRYDIRLDAWVQNREGTQGIAFYTAPPQREWQGLTDREIDELFLDHMEELFHGRDYDYERAIEAKLKEKNHG